MTRSMSQQVGFTVERHLSLCIAARWDCDRITTLLWATRSVRPTVSLAGLLVAAKAAWTEQITLNHPKESNCSALTSCSQNNAAATLLFAEHNMISVEV
ncbi:TPA: hypothetical protein ACH3X1_016548 [Trebouxia sp. C0004]